MSDLIDARERALLRQIANAERFVRHWQRHLKASECVLERTEMYVQLDLAMGYLADLQNALVMLDRVRRERAASLDL